MNGRYVPIGLLEFDYGSPVTEAIVGFGALALAILGLAHVFPWVLASVATMALGAALVFESGAVSRRFSLLAGENAGMAAPVQNAWSGITAGFVAGCAGIALGILSILAIRTSVLVPAAIIIYGAGLIIDSRMRLTLREMESEQAGLPGAALKVSREQGKVFLSIQLIVGLAVIVLGILAIMRIEPETLSLTALLTMGATVVLFSLPNGKFKLT